MSERQKAMNVALSIDACLRVKYEDLIIHEAVRLLREAADILRSRDLNQPVAWQWRVMLGDEWMSWINGDGLHEEYRYAYKRAIASGRIETRELFA